MNTTAITTKNKGVDKTTPLCYNIDINKKEIDIYGKSKKGWSGL